MYAIGLMSGTSLDGIDAVVCQIEGIGEQTQLQQIVFETYPLPDIVKSKILAVCRNEATTETICSLNFEMGKLLSNAVSSITKKAGLQKDNIAFVASHGQTVYHIPHPRPGYVASTLQIGEPAVIAFENNVIVISNFRVMDMAAQGEGAPLVPYSEYILYGNKGKSIALQNIGGIGNVTYIPSQGSISDVRAFDTGPGNMMIDEAMKQLFHRSYDHNGEVAASGFVHQAMLSELLSHPFLTKLPPKSTGREEFGQEYVSAILEKYKDLQPQDIVATLTLFTAKTIIMHYEAHIGLANIDQVMVGGGGAHNNTLMKHLRHGLPGIEVVTQDEAGYSSDAKEAVAFVILGNETMHQRTSNVPSATGAKNHVILGNITPKPQGGFHP